MLESAQLTSSLSYFHKSTERFKEDCFHVNMVTSEPLFIDELFVCLMYIVAHMPGNYGQRTEIKKSIKPIKDKLGCYTVHHDDNG